MTKKLSSTAVTFILLGIAAALLLFSTIGGAKATLDEAAMLELQMGTKTMELVLKENGTAVEDGGELLGSLKESGEGIKPGKLYDESLTVTNTGKITTYVRVTVYRYWTSTDGKDVTLSPELIKVIADGTDWLTDEAYSTPERVMFYYTKPLEPGETTTSPISGIMIDGKVLGEIGYEVSDDGKTITLTYEYDGLTFGFEAEVDGVQARNGQDAIPQEWGREVTIGSDGSLSF